MISPSAKGNPKITKVNTSKEFVYIVYLAIRTNNHLR